MSRGCWGATVHCNSERLCRKAYSGIPRRRDSAAVIDTQSITLVFSHYPMDLSAHRTILFLAIDRLRSHVNRAKFLVPAEGMADQLFYGMWLGNWLTDMSQASAFFDVLENKYRDPYTRWRTRDDYDFPAAIAQHKNEWVSMYNSLWDEECKTVNGFRNFAGIARPAGICIDDANEIGGYFPYDHFDVADRMLQNERGEWLLVPDCYEYDNARDGRSATIRQGVFSECLNGPLSRAFSARDRLSPSSLRQLGKATHILQDFFAHSNFVELMLLCAPGLPNGLTSALKSERAGSFASFLEDGEPRKAIVVTGRFDQVDTVASILKIYRQHLVYRWDDLRTQGFWDNTGKTRDLMVEVLFGTFSDNPFVPRALRAVKTALIVKDFVAKLGDTVRDGVIAFFGWCAKEIAHQDEDGSIGKIQTLLEAATGPAARDYANYGRVMYLERVIESRLLAELERAKRQGERILPHHTLLAKDQDVSQPETRLAFKIACRMAVDVTVLVLEQYLLGNGIQEVERILRRCIVHPTVLLDETRAASVLESDVPRLYGERWWMYRGESML